MPKLTPRSIGHDAQRGQTYLLASYGKDRYILAIDRDMQPRIVRKVKPPDDAFWIGADADGQPCAVFWSIGKNVLVPLGDEGAKQKNVKIEGAQATPSRAAFAPAPDQLHSIIDRSVYRFDGDRWTNVDGSGDATAVLVTLDGVHVRPLAGTPSDWKTIHSHKAVRATISVSASAARCLVGVHGGEHVVIGLDGSDPRPVKLGSIWGSVAYDGGFFAWADYKVHAVGHDGTATDTGLTSNEEAADTCLFNAGDEVLFIKGTTIDRYRAGVWTKHDIAASASSLGLT